VTLEQQRRVETILVTEDEALVRKVTVSILEDSGYSVLSARDADEAMRLAEHCSSVDLLVADVMMPKTTGPELAEKLARSRPGLRVLFISGYDRDELIQMRMLKKQAGAFLRKPFTRTQLASKVRELLDDPLL
jgi:two-component system cell cycle sensor histidine kinase/response regulator CckA